MFNLVRWVCFFIFKPLDYLVLLLQILYLPYFYFKVIQRGLVKKQPITNTREVIINNALNEVPNSEGFIAKDSHTLICELGNGLIRPELRYSLIKKMVTDKGSLLRRYPDNQSDPSSDCLASWSAAYQLWGIDDKELLKKVAIPYIKNCFALDWHEKGGPGTRSSNSGIMPSMGAWPFGTKWWVFKWGIQQPMTGAFFYSTLGFLGLCRAKLGGVFSFIYWFYYLINLGPLQSLVPVLYTKTNTLYYLHHIVMLNLWVLRSNFGGFERQMRFVGKTISHNYGLSPWVAGFAIESGVLGEDDRIKAMNTLLSIDGAHQWPQYQPGYEGFFKGDPDKGWSNMYLGLWLLTKKDNKIK